MHNTAMLKGGSTEADPANVVMESDRKDLPLRKLAKHILVSQFDALEPVALPKIKEFLEKVALSLRLGTSGRILLDALALQPGTKDRLVSKGSEQPALFPVGRADQVVLSQEDCEALGTAQLLLAYDPKFDIPLMHFTTGSYKSSDHEIGLDFLLGLETMFAPGETSRGRSDKVARRAAMFAATSTDQQRKMAIDIRQAYKHRSSLRHGEPDPAKITAAKSWFNNNTWDLRVICSWGFQRVLGLTRCLPGFELMRWVEDLEQGDRNKLKLVQEFPLCWIASEQMVLN